MGLEYPARGFVKERSENRVVGVCWWAGRLLCWDSVWVFWIALVVRLSVDDERYQGQDFLGDSFLYFS